MSTSVTLEHLGESNASCDSLMDRILTLKLPEDLPPKIEPTVRKKKRVTPTRILALSNEVACLRKDSGMILADLLNSPEAIQQYLMYLKNVHQNLSSTIEPLIGLENPFSVPEVPRPLSNGIGDPLVAERAELRALKQARMSIGSPRPRSGGAGTNKMTRS